MRESLKLYVNIFSSGACQYPEQCPFQTLALQWEEPRCGADTGVSKRASVHIGVTELSQCPGVLQKLRHPKNKRGHLGRKKSVL